VASRGRLRGLSLPIAKSPPVPAAAKKTPIPWSRASTTTTASQWSHADGDQAQPRQEERNGTSDQPAQGPVPGLAQGPWGNVGYATSLPTAAAVSGAKYPKLDAHLSHIPVSADIPSSSMDSLSEVDYLSPLGHSFSQG